MTYATVLLHLDDGPRMDARIDAAIRLSARFGSHLVGIAASSATPLEARLATGMALQAQLVRALDDLRIAARARAARFEARAAALQAASFEAIVEDDDDAGALMARSRCADLLILGQPDTASPQHAHDRARLDQLVLNSAAPTLVLPSAAEFADPGRTILVAWNGSPEAARAVTGAMPLLLGAHKVHLMQFDTPLDFERDDDPSVLALPRAWLAHHGVHADAWLEQTDLDAGEALQARARDLGADLIVMGSWGRPRWTERVLGGATRTMLGAIPLPLLMSH